MAGIDWNDISSRARGGTELMMMGLEARLSPDLLEQVQIIPGRVRSPLDPSKIRILWCHDLRDDPESAHLADGGWRRFHRIVFVSNQQMQKFIDRFGIPWGRCVVLQNAIEPIEPDHRSREASNTINLIYTSTPHRGLNVLLGAFSELHSRNPDVRLEVFSSFSLYGWDERDRPFQPLFDFCENHPAITYRGAQENDVVRLALSRSHVLAYPSTWEETSCLCLIEAMSSDLVCCHSNLGALPETAANWTMMYPFHEDPTVHAGHFLTALETAVGVARDRDWSKVSSQKLYTDTFYNWELRVAQWEALIRSLLDENRGIESTYGDFEYEVG